MAGGGKYPAVLTDPAIEKWYHMKENTHTHYRLNRRTARIGLMLTFAIPLAVYVGCSQLIGEWQPKGARKGEQFIFRKEKQ